MHLGQIDCPSVALSCSLSIPLTLHEIHRISSIVSRFSSDTATHLRDGVKGPSIHPGRVKGSSTRTLVDTDLL